MSRARRMALAAAVVLVVLGGGAFALRKPLVLRAMARVAADNLGTDLLRELPDGLHVGLCGAGSPMPDPSRSGPCTAVIAGDRLFIVDAGSGASRVLARMRLPQGEIEALFLTHLHSDHIDGLGELQLQRWATGTQRAPLPVHGPTGVEQVVAGINTAYGPSRASRVLHHGAEVVPPGAAGAVAHPFASPPDGEGVVLLDDGELKVTAFRVDHDPVEPAVGYRFDYAGRSVTLSGDTDKSANLQKFAQGTDLLVHEALDPELTAVLRDAAEHGGRDKLATILADILDYHATPEEAAETARDAGARYLLFNHIVPMLRVRVMEEIFVEGVAEIFDGPFSVGTDGTFVRMPRGSDRIEVNVELF